MVKYLCGSLLNLHCSIENCQHGEDFIKILHQCISVLESLSKGDTSQKVTIFTDKGCLKKLVDTIHRLTEEVEEFLNLNHELAIGICEHFDVLRKLQQGDYSVRASEDSPVEIVRMLGQLINKQRDRFLDYIERLKEQHAEIVHSYEQQNAILSSVGVAIVVVDEDMTIEFVNKELEDLVGYSKKELEGKFKWTYFVPEELLNTMIEYHKLRRISPHLAPRQYEAKIKDREGKIKDVLINVAMIPYTKKSIASIIDISERKKIQEQLIHSHKMQALGLLSGRVAHEFNNILSGILGFANLIEEKIEDSLIKNYSRKIIEAGERARDLAKNLLTFSRKEAVGESKKINLSRYLLEFAEFIRPIIGRDIQVKLKIPEDEISYRIDPSHLEVILMNLVTNARDAMPDGGTLTLGLKDVNLDMDYYYTHPLVKPGHYVAICVTDTGIGMDKETKERIFEPFFTTKPKGKGTGLGLSTVFGLIKGYGGHIHVYSEPGKGTTFKIYLPHEEKRDTLIIDRKALKGDETILVVDDDEQIRRYFSAILKDFGYSVIEASDGFEAVNIVEDNKDLISLCLVDLVMPGISGIETVKQIRKISDKIKIIIMSGHPIDLKEFESIEKTISADELLYKIRNMLDKKE